MAPTYHYEPDVNDKRSMTKDDPAGWYQITFWTSGPATAQVYWWNGREWNWRPNMRRGLGMDELRGVVGITRLVSAT
jgi:hypothetical protein